MKQKYNHAAVAKPKPKSADSKRPKKQAKDHSAKSQPALKHDIPTELQQLLLTIFQNAFQEPQDRPLSDVLQEVKKHLYNRDFGTAFGSEEYLRAYALRWSPSRALCYLKLLDGIFKGNLENSSKSEPAECSQQVVKMTCLGGGAGAELVAIAGLLALRTKPSSAGEIASKQQEVETGVSTLSGLRIEADFVDIADWENVIDILAQGAVTAPPLSAYASAAAKASNVPLLDASSISANFVKRDVLDLSEQELKNMVHGKNVITILFTLNELYTMSITKTQAFLLALTQAVEIGSLLLVVDSAGSYSSVGLNGHEKKYPMHWLLDHALLDSLPEDRVRGAEDRPRWDKLQEQESEWFRIPEGLRYPLELENMRYQLHLYRRL
jgi:25S rRNA (uracil2843-N3)-methyltransferase